MKPDFDPDSGYLHPGLFALPHRSEESAVLIVPVPWEATVCIGGGASRGPEAVFEASRQVDLLDLDVGRPWVHGIAAAPVPGDVAAWNAEAKALAGPVIAAGGPASRELAVAVARVDELSRRMNDCVKEAVGELLDQGKVVGVLGGDHSVSLGAIAAYARRWPGLGLLHVDAHADLRVAYEGFTYSHASIMHNVLEEVPGVSRLVQVALRDVAEGEFRRIEAEPGRIATFFDADIRRSVQGGTPFSRIADRIAEALPPVVYVSFDIDGLDPALCPGTGTPVPGGLAFAEVAGVLEALVRAGRRIVGFDLTEVAPLPGGTWDGNVAARILYKLIGYALWSQGRGGPARARPGFGG